MTHVQHLTLQVGPFMIDVPLIQEGIDLAKEFLSVMEKFFEDQSSGDNAQ